MRLKTLPKKETFRGKIVLVRTDCNVPIVDGKVTDESKIIAAAPTIAHLSQAGARVVVLSHLGRPKGFDLAFSLRPVAKSLSQILEMPVLFDDVFYWQASYTAQVKKRIAALSEGGILFLENTRFAPGEDCNDDVFAKRLAGYADMFILDGFAVAHRDAASVSGVAQYLPSCAGLLLSREVTGLSKAFSAERPSVLVIGGVKMETKIPVLLSLAPRMSAVCLVGGVASTYFFARGYGVGDSLVDKDEVSTMLRALKKGNIVPPVDVVVGAKDGSRHRVVSVSSTPSDLCSSGESILDIGPETIRLLSDRLREAKTIVWNGACGYMEQKPYDTGTLAVARLVGSVSRGSCFGIVGGGETVQALALSGMSQYVDLVSTGGGAMLEFLSGKKLPGIRAVSSWW